VAPPDRIWQHIILTWFFDHMASHLGGRLGHLSGVPELPNSGAGT
jgi:hypothetical protein